MTNKKILSASRQLINSSQQDQQQKLSYQTNKLSNYIQLQLSDLQNTLHYIQKKHSLNQIKQSISHSYSIFSETQPIFRQLRILFIYNKIKKLINCFSIVYLILMEHIEKPKNNILIQKLQQIQQAQLTDNLQIGVSVKKANDCQVIVQVKRPNRLGGINLFNEQYNRHVESDLDRLKRKLKEQKKQQKQNNKISEKQKLKQDILKQINTDIYGSPSPDQLTLFFNLNNNRFGSQLQYITFQDQLQQIATFFKQSQDDALQFLNKSRDQFMFINFNQGFKQALSQYKSQKEGQVNVFIDKVKILFNTIKQKTLKTKTQMEIQYTQLKRLQSKVKRQDCIEVQTQTVKNFQEQFQLITKKYQELQKNYEALKQFKQNGNEDQEKSLAVLQHKIAFKDRQIGILKQQLTQKNHFIDFLNQKINLGLDTRTLRKISNLYKVHSKKNSSKLKIQLLILQKETGNSVRTSKITIKNARQRKAQKGDNLEEEVEQTQNQNQLKYIQKMNSTTSQLQNMQKLKKKRKAGFSFFANDKKFTSSLSRKGSFNFNNIRQVQQRDDINETIEEEDTNKFQDEIMDDYQSVMNQKINSTQKIQYKRGISKKNLVLKQKQKNKIDARSSLQVSLSTSSKRFQPKLSSFGSRTKNNNQNKQKRISNMCLQNQQQLLNEDDQQFQNQSELKNQQQIPNFDENADIYQQDESYLKSQQEVQDQFLSTFINSQKQIKINQSKPRILKTSSVTYTTNNKFNKTTKNSSNQVKPSKASQKQNTLKMQRKQQGSQQVRHKKQVLTNQQKLINEAETNKNQPLNFQKSSKMNNQITKGKNPKLTYTTATNSDINRHNPAKDQIQQFNQQQQNYEQQNGSQNSLTNRNQKYQNEQLQNQGQFSSTINQKNNQNLSLYYTNLYRQELCKTSTICSNIFQIKIIPKIGDKIKQLIINQSNQNKGGRNKVLNQNQIGSNRSKQRFFQQANSSKNIHLRQISQKSSQSKNKIKKSQNEVQQKVLDKYQHKNNQICQSSEGLQQQNIQYDAQNNALIDGLISYKQIEQSKDKNKIKNQQNSNQKLTSYDKIYGFYSTGRAGKDNTWQNYSKQKMEEYLQKVAIKTALKVKNIQEFKAKIKKMHQSKCGNNCKHLQRYIQNFNKYKFSARSTMKLHIQNMHQHMTNHHLKEQNGLPSINLNKVSFGQMSSVKR